MTHKDKLLAEKEDLLKRIARLEHPVDMGSDVDSGDEEADEAEELANNLAKASDLKKRLEEIEVELNKSTDETT